MAGNPLSIFNNLKKLSLTSEEKTAVRLRLISAMQARTPVPLRKSFFTSFSLLLRPASTALIIVLLTTAGIAFAAESSAPGDFLYPVKINFTEPVATTVLEQTPAAADWQIKKAERRLEEAEQLAADNRLTPEATAELKNKFEKEAEDVEQAVGAEAEENAAFRDTKKIRRRANFEAKLRAHSEILTRLKVKRQEEFRTEQNEINDLIEKIRNKSDKASEARRRDLERLNSKPITDLERGVQNEHEEVKEKLQKVKNRLDRPETNAAARGRLKEAEDSESRGREKLDNRSYGEAFELFSATYRRLEEAETLNRATQKLHLDLDTFPKSP